MCFSNDLNNIVKYDSSDIEKSISFEINNIGDPVLLLTPKFLFLPTIYYIILPSLLECRFFEKHYSESGTSIVSRVYYSNCYNEGGFFTIFCN